MLVSALLLSHHQQYNRNKMTEKFKTVLLDPPWYERGGGKIKRGADKHYPIMKTPDIIRTITQCEHWNNIDDNAHMYLWVTNNHLESGLFVMRSLGFRYVTNIVWVKDRIGLGQYARGKHELLLFGTRGVKHTSVKKNNNSLSLSLFISSCSRSYSS